jgi:hypothetical protein
VCMGMWLMCREMATAARANLAAVGLLQQCVNTQVRKGWGSAGRMNKFCWLVQLLQKLKVSRWCAAQRCNQCWLSQHSAPQLLLCPGWQLNVAWDVETQSGGECLPVA